MAPAKRNDIRSAQRWSRQERPPASRRGREHWTVRWIGAASRRSPKPAAEPVMEVPGACIIRLGWADTFGRPTRAGPLGAVVRLAL